MRAQLFAFAYGAVATFLAAAVGAFAAPPAYPLKVSPNHRYLLDQKGEPFLLQGDAAWSLISGTTWDEADAYLRDRAARGFNTVLVNLIEHKFKGPKNRDGETPFLTPGDFSTPNEKYFSHADRVIRRAAEYGIQVLLAPCYLGYKGLDEGWYDEVMANGPERLRQWGLWTARRYRDFGNIMWLIGGDRDPGQALPHMAAMASAIREADPRHLETAHCAPETPTAVCYAGQNWLDVNATYTYKLVHALLIADYNRKPARPFFLIESTYEGEHDSTPVVIRRQAWWALLNGGFGHIMGNRPIWLFDPGWQAALDAPASRDMIRLGRFMRAFAWFDLIPDHRREFLDAGWRDPAGLDYAAAATTRDHRAAVVYMPTARTVSVRLGRLKGRQATVCWFDPATGERTPAGVFPARGTHEFAPPGPGDWVLLFMASR